MNDRYVTPTTFYLFIRCETGQDQRSNFFSDALAPENCLKSIFERNLKGFKMADSCCLIIVQTSSNVILLFMIWTLLTTWLQDEWVVTIVQLIALFYKDQHVENMQKLLGTWINATTSESSEDDDESNTSPPVRILDFLFFSFSLH